MKKLIIIGMILNVMFSTGMIAPFNANSIVYANPVAGATDINPETTITVRYSGKLNLVEAANIQIQVVGSLSGSHSGKVVLSDDQKTAIFRPDKSFSNGERVTVSVPGKNPYSFTISKGKLPAVDSLKLLDPDEKAAFLPKTPVSPKTVKPSASQKTYVTVPSDFPNIQVTVPANGTADGDLFFSIFNWQAANPGPYTLIVDDQGEPVFYQRLGAQDNVTDFKKLPNGDLSYFDNTLGYFNILDNSYHLVDTIRPGNGYAEADGHDLQLLPNGHFLFLIYDSRTVDMSAIVPGGNHKATVLGLVIQELDSAKNVVFEWRSWDHFSILDSYVDLTASLIDYVHGNAVSLDSSDPNGNLLLSSRHMAEITKIDHTSGNIIWRLGGKNNQFTFTNGAIPFFYQHDIRRLPNGDISLFDNHDEAPFASRALEYSIDEAAKTITQVWEYHNSPDTYSLAMGNVQRLSNGNTLIGWGSAVSPLLTEVKPDGTKAMEITLDAPQVSYRSYRFTWHGYPTWPPALVVQTTSGSPQLFFSWNGATEIASYRVYAGNTPLPTTLIAEQPKTSFETSLPLLGSLQTYCYFRVMPVDNLGRVTQYSDVVYNPACGRTIYVPSVYSNPGTANGQSLFSQR